jgi:predicted nuclease with TOPRIM domain
MLQQQLVHQHQLQMQQQIQQIFSPAEGEALIMDLSKAIELQLEDIAKKSKLLLEMQNELEAIHAAGKEQLDSLQSEKSLLLTQRDSLQEQLTAVSERLVVVDRSIEEAEKEKLYKLQSWQMKSATHGLVTHNHGLLTNH